MTTEPLRRPFIIGLASGPRRIVAIERHADLTFLISDQGGAINHAFLMQMLRTGAATFDIDQPPEPIGIKLTVDKATLKRIVDAFREIKDKLAHE